MTCHFLLWYEQALRAGMVPLGRGARPASASVGRAHHLRILDACRLPELGHRLQLQALARRQDVRARPPGTVRDRAVAALPRAARDRALGEVHARRRLRSLPAPLTRGAGWSGHRALGALRDQREPSRPKRAGAVRGPHARGCGACGRPRAGRPRSGRAAAALLIRSRHRQARDHDPGYSTADPAGEPARGSVRRNRARTALRPQPARGIEHRRPSLGELRCGDP